MVALSAILEVPATFTVENQSADGSVVFNSPLFYTNIPSINCERHSHLNAQG